MTTPASSTTAWVNGRRVKISRGTKSQTVNICTTANEVGSYEMTYRLPPDVDVTTSELESLADVDALVRWLGSHRGQPEVPGLGYPRSRLLPRVAAPAADDEWVVAAAAAADAAITQLVDSFLEHPYLHRVEHSLHTLLHSLLKEQPQLKSVTPLGSRGNSTQLVHKEWPETVPGVEGDDTGPRGLFDIAVVTPSQLAEASVDQFLEGRIDAPLAIEVGLDYGLKHLSDDAAKLLHSKVPVPYLLHLTRLRVKDLEETERLLCEAPSPLRTAYVQVDPRTGARRYKHLADSAVFTAGAGRPGDVDRPVAVRQPG